MLRSLLIFALAALLLFVLRGTTTARLAKLWPGPPEGLAVITRLAAD